MQTSVDTDLRSIRIAWGLFLLACVGWLAMGGAPIGWSAAVAVVAVVQAFVPALRPYALALAAAVCIYSGAAASGFSWVRLGVGAAALPVALYLTRQPRPWLGVVGLIGASLSVVSATLSTTAWTPEAERLGNLSCGLVWGVVAFLCGAYLLQSSTWRQFSAAVFVLALAAAAAQVFLPQDFKNVLPAWRGVSASMTSAPSLQANPNALTDDTLSAIERLRATGAPDAAYAWVALALRQNADAAMVRPVCPKPGLGQTLNPNWQGWVDLGKQACAALRVWPEDGARALANPADPALSRLAADLLMEAGAVDSATQAYAQATTQGDPFAQRDAVAALLQRGRHDAAVKLRDANDILQHHWFDPGDTTAVVWRAYNHALDFGTLAAPLRTNLLTLESPGNLASLYDPLLGRRVLSTLPSYAAPFVLGVATPPGGDVPQQLQLFMRKRGDAWLQLTNTQGTVVRYSCTPGGTDLLLPPAFCSGVWTQVQLEPRRALAGKLQSLTVGGNFLLAYVAASPEEGTP